MLTFLLAIENISLILATPLFSLSVNSAPDANTNGNPLFLASVLAKSVFPVPGGPERRTPCFFPKTKKSISSLQIQRTGQQNNPCFTCMEKGKEGNGKVYPHKLHPFFIVLHRILHINHQLIKKIPDITTQNYFLEN